MSDCPKTALQQGRNPEAPFGLSKTEAPRRQDFVVQDRRRVKIRTPVVKAKRLFFSLSAALALLFLPASSFAQHGGGHWR
jgi:hypothetical protein